MGLIIQTRSLFKFLNNSLYLFDNGNSTMPAIKIKRVYDKPADDDGYRILVDRLWPRGLTKQKAAIDEWAKELAPSSQLRNWFDHDPFYWEGFKEKYKDELKQNQELDSFIKKHKDKKSICLVYGTRYDKLTHAIILKEILERKYKLKARGMSQGDEKSRNRQ